MQRIIQIGLVAVLLAAPIACTVQSEEVDLVADDTPAVAAEPLGADTPASSSLGAPDFPEPEPQVVYQIPAGTALRFTLVRGLTTEQNVAGEEFEARLAEAVIVDGDEVFVQNATAFGTIVSSERAGRVRGVARIELAMTRIEANGQTYEINTIPFVAEADTERAEDATRIGVGAGIGAAIGAALGGGDGAAVGAAIGGGAGTAVVLTDRGDDVTISADSPIQFELAESVTVSR